MWRIWYADGSTFEGEAREAPRTGVVAITQDDDAVGYVVIHGHDYYYREFGEWHTTDLIGAFDHLVRCREPLVLVGRMMSTPEYRALLQRIHATLGPKTNYTQEECRR